MIEVVAALIWDKDKFMICQRPAHKAGPCPGVPGGTGRHGRRRRCVYGCDPRIPRPDGASDPLSCHHPGRRAPKAGAQ